DLVLRPGPGSDICYLSSGAAPNRRLAIEWKDALAFDANAKEETHLTFELVLAETTNTLDFVYLTITSAAGDETYVNGMSALIGLQSAGGAVFSEHSGTVTTTAAVRFSP